MLILDPVDIAAKPVLVNEPSAHRHDPIVLAIDAPGVEQRHPVLKRHVGELVFVVVHTLSKVEGIHPEEPLNLVVDVYGSRHVCCDFSPGGAKDVGRKGRGVVGRLGDDVDQPTNGF